MAVEYRHSTEYTWVSEDQRQMDHVADLDGHMKLWTDAGWSLHSMSTANGGEVFRGFCVRYTFIWQREDGA
jgi:hypothetical protein